MMLRSFLSDRLNRSLSIEPLLCLIIGGSGLNQRVRRNSLVVLVATVRLSNISAPYQPADVFVASVVAGTRYFISKRLKEPSEEFQFLAMPNEIYSSPCPRVQFNAK